MATLADLRNQIEQTTNVLAIADIKETGRYGEWEELQAQVVEDLGGDTVAVRKVRVLVKDREQPGEIAKFTGSEFAARPDDQFRGQVATYVDNQIGVQCYTIDSIDRDALCAVVSGYDTSGATATRKQWLIWKPVGQPVTHKEITS